MWLLLLAASASGGAVGRPALRAAVILFLSLPVAAVFALFPKRESSKTAELLRHAISIASTLTLLHGCYDPILVARVVGAVLASYALVRIAPSSTWTPLFVTTANLLHLAALYIYIQLLHPGSDDVSAPLMVVVIKMSTFSWAVYDGTLPSSQLSPGQNQRAIKEIPSLTEFLGYSLFFANFLVGPAFEFSEYRRWARNEEPYSKAPSSFIPFLRTFTVSIVTTGIFLKFGGPWSHEHCVQESFLKYSLLFRLWYIQVAGLIQRCKYYGVWKLAEAACILCGVGYSGYLPVESGTAASSKSPTKFAHRWVAASNASVYDVETAQCPRDYIGNWNLKTNQWMRNSVYLRLVKSVGVGSSVASLLTWMASAFWHGFYPGYYLTFLSGALLTGAGASIRQTLRPLVVSETSPFVRLRPLYDFLGWVFTQAAMNYICGPFPLQRLDLGIKLWASVGYIIHVGMIVGAALAYIPGLRAAVRRVSGEKRKSE
ncbi:MBOAT, membrane-bound O-acyltransferase family-domain-containing protein [Zopfochytrium polystomum]|nr:MBOAT, membrane-bound O-acyltransferase family-domain-containing protein [Zopfochytrium polystomum]